MYHLNLAEEKIILNAINEGKMELITTGSSRIAFETPVLENLSTEEENLFKKIGIYNDLSNYIIKIGLTSAGLNQNSLEVDTFINLDEWEGLATIAAEGRFVIIMETVNVLDEGEIVTLENMSEYEDEKEYAAQSEYEQIDVNTWYELHSLSLKEASCQYYEIVNSISEVLGDTEDNSQIGISLSRNRLVIYDYGFDSNDDECGKKYTHGYTHVMFDNMEVLTAVLDKLAFLEEEIYENYSTADLGTYMNNMIRDIIEFFEEEEENEEEQY